MSERQKVSLILLVALVLRELVVAAAWRSPHALVGDSHGYIAPAESLASHMTFRPEGMPEIFRTPGYPFFLLLGFGAVQIAQLLLSVATVYLTYRLGKELASASAALWAAGLQSLSVISIAVCPVIVTECVYAFQIVAAHPLLAVRVHLVDSLGSLLPGSNVLLEMLGVTARGTGTLSVLQQQGAVAAWNHYFQSNPSAVS